jgi:SpoVK/Ycf46/Vps4 family AAA+-type ATPase
MQAVFVAARAAAPCLLFFDEIDSLCSSRDANGGGGGVSGGAGDGDGSTRRITTEFLTQMSALRPGDGVTVVAATNRPFDLDAAVGKSCSVTSLTAAIVIRCTPVFTQLLCCAAS